MKLWFILIAVSGAVADEVDDRIEQLNREIKALRLKAMQEEVGGSEQLRTNDRGLVKDIEAAEKYEDAVRDKEKELEQILHKKASK